MAAMSHRLLASVALAALLVALAVLLVLRVPWSTAPAPRADQLAALGDLPADAVAKGRAFHSALRPGTYGALVVGAGGGAGARATPLARALSSWWAGRSAGTGWPRRCSGAWPVVLVGQTGDAAVRGVAADVLRRTGCPPRPGAPGSSTCSRDSPSARVIGGGGWSASSPSPSCSRRAGGGRSGAAGAAGR
jgi:hypothetical protein